jgi:hypothetical protein
MPVIVTTQEDHGPKPVWAKLFWRPYLKSKLNAKELW